MKHNLLFILALSLALICKASVDIDTAGLQKEYVQIQDINDELAPGKDSGELNETDILLKRMYREEKKEKVKTAEELYLEQEKQRQDERSNDELLTKIVVGVFGFTIFLWILSKYFEWKYRREGAELGEEEKRVEKEYTDKFNQYNSNKNKKRR